MESLQFLGDSTFVANYALNWWHFKYFLRNHIIISLEHIS